MAYMRQEAPSAAYSTCGRQNILAENVAVSKPMGKRLLLGTYSLHESQTYRVVQYLEHIT